MTNRLDSLLIDGKHAVVSWFPEVWQPWVSILLTISAILTVFPLLFAVTTILERKGLGRIQNRFGPNRVGPYGLLQPIADGLKMLFKENVVPRTADQLVHFLAPLVLVIPVVLAYSVIPYGRGMAPIDLDAGVLFFLAVGAATELAVFMAGWSSHNKYSLLGAMRGIAQMISYEIPLILSVIPVIMMVGSLSLVSIVEAQGGWFGWHVFTPWGLAGLLLFLVAAIAEANRSPFDIPEGESEIVAGYFVEYSGFKFSLFFMGEYLGLFAASGLAITLFLGGWQAPAPFLNWVPSYIWFFAKLLALIGLFIWIRGTVPRLRMDQLMNLAWKFMLPLALINIVVAGLWRYLPVGFWRWGICLVFLAVPYILLARGLASGKKLGKRTYRFA